MGRDGGNPEVLLPLDVVKGIYEKNDKVYFASALSFEVTDPMMLNEAKKALSDAGLKETIYGSPNSYVGIGVKLTDSVFIRSMESADRSLTLLESFLPFIFLIVAAGRIYHSSLLFQNRTRRVRSHAGTRHGKPVLQSAALCGTYPALRQQEPWQELWRNGSRRGGRG